MKQTYSYGCLLLLAMCLLPGCGGGSGETPGGFKDDGRANILATTTMIADLAQVIGGDEVEVIGVMKSGEDPHIYDVRPNDAQLVRQADVILMNGLHLEATLGEVVEKTKGKVVALAEDDKIKPITGGEGLESAPDPHCWMDIAHYKVYAQKTRDALIEAAPEHEALFKQRTADYLKKLDELDQWVRAQIKTIPEKQRVLITAHDAFAYYGRAYGIEVHGLIGISTEQQMLTEDIKRVEGLIQSRGLKALFVETSTEGVLNDQVRKLARKTGIVVSEAKLFSDALDEPGKPAGTYIGMIKHNTQTIVKGLKGE